MCQKTNSAPSDLLPLDTKPIDPTLIGVDYIKKEIVDAD